MSLGEGDGTSSGQTVGEERRRVHGYLVCIDRRICVGFEDCLGEAPGAFRLDEEGIATFAMPEQTEPSRLLAACAACPVDAIRVLDEEGRPVVP